MLSRLQRQRLHFVVVDALERDCPEVQVYRDPDRDSPQTRGVAACLASHLRALRQFVDSSADETIVVEDDVVLAKNFSERFARLRSNFPKDCQIVCLSYLVWDWDELVWVGPDLCNAVPDTYGTQMYWIRRSFAEECLRRFDRPFADIETFVSPITSELITREMIGRGGLLAYPPLALEDLSGSLIVPEAGVANHPEALAVWDRDEYDFDKP